MTRSAFIRHASNTPWLAPRMFTSLGPWRQLLAGLALIVGTAALSAAAPGGVRSVLDSDAEAVILGSTHAADYRNADPFIDGVGQEMGYALIVTVDARQVAIEGAGTIDGQGAAVKAAQEKYTIRPFLVRWVRCTNVTVKDVSLVNSGAWTMHFFQCKNVAAERLTIRSLGLANNDGIDTDSCDGVRIRDCDTRDLSQRLFQRLTVRKQP